MEETHRMLFGTPGAEGLLYWGWWASATNQGLQGGGVLVEADLMSFTPVGDAWTTLRDSWNTEATLMVGPDGTIDLNGFYGDYEIEIDGVTYDLVHAKGDTLHSIVVAPGDYNSDGKVDAGDYTVWRNSLGMPGDLRADGNGNEMIDDGDYAVWKTHYGDVYDIGGGALATVPEPTGIALLAMGSVLCAGFHRRRR
jgi:hypothetical protein